jgi:uncharacterized protein (TIGR03083 family)
MRCVPIFNYETMRVPIQTIHLFPSLDKKLIELLTSLSESDWQKPTRAKAWTVKDIATHLLDGNFRTLSMSRDKYFGEIPGELESYRDLVKYLNGLNADWVKATKRLSPKVLTALLESSGMEYYAHLKTLDPFAPSIFSVDWAGERTSANWFHIAREFTEKWHHQQQIREAVNQNQPGIMNRDLYFPVLETFMQALPYTFSTTPAPAGTRVKINIEGEAGGIWIIQMQDAKWQFTTGGSDADTHITMHQNNAWKLLTKGLSKDEAKDLVQFSGQEIFAQPVFSMTTVMA